MGDPEANKKYDVALAAREATEKLVEALDEPIYDSAYEYAFKASACLRKALNSLEESGAHPMPTQRVVAPPAKMQKYAGSVPYQGAYEYGANGVAAGMIEEQGMADLDPKVKFAMEAYETIKDNEELMKQFHAYLAGSGER